MWLRAANNASFSVSLYFDELSMAHFDELSVAHLKYSP